MGLFIIESDCQRLDKYLRRRFGSFPQAALQKVLRKKLIKLNGALVEASSSVVKGDSLFLNQGFLEILSSPRNPKKEEFKTSDSKLVDFIVSTIIYEDENILAINKPFGIAVQSGEKVKESIDRVMKTINAEYRVVHRLDKHTTGVLLFAKNLETTRELWQLFSNRLIKKKYLAIVVGKLKENEGQIDSYVKKTLVKGEEIMQCNNEGEGERAITQFRVSSAFEHLSVVELFPLTGRKHQIRTQMASIGHPILNDGKYGRKQAFIGQSDNKKLSLHALEVEFELFGKPIKIVAPLPRHFLANLPVK